MSHQSPQWLNEPTPDHLVDSQNHARPVPERLALYKAYLATQLERGVSLSRGGNPSPKIPETATRLGEAQRVVLQYLSERNGIASEMRPVLNLTTMQVRAALHTLQERKLIYAVERYHRHSIWGITERGQWVLSVQGVGD